MAYRYDGEWHDYPPNWNEWLEQTSESRQIGAKLLITDKITKQAKGLEALIDAMAAPLGKSFLEILFESGQDYPRRMELDRERDISLRAMENIIRGIPQVY